MSRPCFGDRSLILCDSAHRGRLRYGSRYGYGGLVLLCRAIQRSWPIYSTQRASTRCACVTDTHPSGGVYNVCRSHTHSPRAALLAWRGTAHVSLSGRHIHRSQAHTHLYIEHTPRACIIAMREGTCLIPHTRAHTFGRTRHESTRAPGVHARVACIMHTSRARPRSSCTFPFCGRAPLSRPAMRSQPRDLCGGARYRSYLHVCIAHV